MSDLPERIRAVVEERKRLAEAETPGPWTTPGPDSIGEWMIYGRKWAVATADVSYSNDPNLAPALRGGITGAQANCNAAHIAANDPADALRDCAYALGVLDRHRPVNGMAEPDPSGEYCARCSDLNQIGEPFPCVEVVALAEPWDIPTTPTEEDQR